MDKCKEYWEGIETLTELEEQIEELECELEDTEEFDLFGLMRLDSMRNEHEQMKHNIACEYNVSYDEIEFDLAH